MDLFGGRTPMLRSVHVDGFAVDLYSSIFKNLTEICLKQLLHLAIHSSCKELVAALENCPSVQLLTLTNTCPLPCVDDSDNMMFSITQPRMRRLSDLRHISTDDDARHCAHFLGHIDYPRSTVTKVIMAIFPDVGDVMVPYREMLAPVIPRYHHEACLQDLEIYRTYDWGELCVKWTPRLHEHILTFRIVDAWMEWEASNVVAICQALPLGKTVSLSLDLESFGPGYLHTTFVHAPLQDVTVHGPAVRDVVASTFGQRLGQANITARSRDLVEDWPYTNANNHLSSLLSTTKITLSKFKLDDLKFDGLFPSGLEALREWYRFMQARAVPLQQLVVTSVQQPDDGPQFNLNVLRQDEIIVDDEIETM